MKKITTLIFVLVAIPTGSYAQEEAPVTDYASTVPFYAGDSEVPQNVLVVIGRRSFRESRHDEWRQRNGVQRSYENDGGERQYVYTRRLFGTDEGVSVGTRLTGTDANGITPRGVPNDNGTRGAFRGALVFPTPLFGTVE
ncbi:MAG TPA: hypothetical protein PK109_01165 [Candidatus Paceibacterota bacterium]|nr:hypothetical protein [Candidatus Paceibacterota bacterium]